MAGSLRGKGVEDVLIEGRGENACETEPLLCLLVRKRKASKQ